METNQPPAETERPLHAHELHLLLDTVETYGTLMIEEPCDGNPWFQREIEGRLEEVAELESMLPIYRRFRAELMPLLPWPEDFERFDDPDYETIQERNQQNAQVQAQLVMTILQRPGVTRSFNHVRQN